MAQLTITVPDAVVPRIRAAFGRRDINNPAVWVPATVVELQDAIKDFVRERVVNYETTLAAETDRTTRSTEVRTW